MKITRTKELTDMLRKKTILFTGTLAMLPAVGSALMGRFNDTSPIGFFESEKNQQRDASSKDLLVFHPTFIRCNNYVSLLPPRGT